MSANDTRKDSDMDGNAKRKSRHRPLTALAVAAKATLLDEVSMQERA